MAAQPTVYEPSSHPTSSVGMDDDELRAIGKSKSSTGLIVGIALGVAAVGGLVIFLATRGGSKNKRTQRGVDRSADSSSDPGKRANSSSRDDGPSMRPSSYGRSVSMRAASAVRRIRRHVPREISVSSVYASSHLKPYKGHVFVPRHVIDGRLDTSWQPHGTGVGHWIRLNLGGTYTVTKVAVANGYQNYTSSFGNLFLKNSRVRRATLSFSNGSSVSMSFPSRVSGYISRSIPNKRTSYVRFKIRSVYRGDRWKDLAVSEIKVYGYR
jgi:hypothetical protein